MVRAAAALLVMVSRVTSSAQLNAKARKVDVRKIQLSAMCRDMAHKQNITIWEFTDKSDDC